MLRYFLILAAAAGVIYAAQHTNMAMSSEEPSFKVWIDQPFSAVTRPRRDPDINVLNVQSREEAPIRVARLLINGDPGCINRDQPQSFEQPMKLGQTLKYTLLCDPVKVVITTDRGEAVYQFN
ncbi:hypothetical protein ABIF07_005468 [Bradyrhizobium elkanii]|uniref:hypothetical protein n=1 Tax=Bradyrhizobium elkanii TaxID=29448 RepID=UPI002168FA07|nr:hypothetical protein [Bradyrhizobium elkanii]MCS3687505.1 hypothetical protein [Bradyrhizobium elkanii]